MAKTKILLSGNKDLAVDLVKTFKENLGPSTLIIDWLYGERALPIAFGVEDEAIYDLYDLINMDLDLEDYAIELKTGRYLIPAPFKEDKRDFSESDLKEFFQALNYDNILVLGNSLEKLEIFKNYKKIHIGEEGPQGALYICDKDKENRIGSIKNFDPQGVYDLFTKGEFYKKGLLGRIKGIFS